MVKEMVVLVDENDNEIGLMEKFEAHRKGLLHRAISVIIFNKNKELMLQRRAWSKYHSPELWSNTCCTHPMKDEDVDDAAHRRLVEEMGFDCNFRKAFDFIYKADVGSGMKEHEFDHVFIGVSSQKPRINTNEVGDWKFMSMPDLRKDLNEHPEQYTVWFKIIFDEVERRINSLEIK